jgi:hypothetical protein
MIFFPENDANFFLENREDRIFTVVHCAVQKRTRTENSLLPSLNVSGKNGMKSRFEKGKK